MLDAFRYLLCSKLCQHNRPVPTKVLILLVIVKTQAVMVVDFMILNALQSDTRLCVGTQENRKLGTAHNCKFVIYANYDLAYFSLLYCSFKTMG